MNILNVCANDYLKIDNDLDIRKIIKEGVYSKLNILIDLFNNKLNI